MRKKNEKILVFAPKSVKVLKRIAKRIARQSEEYALLKYKGAKMINQWGRPYCLHLDELDGIFVLDTNVLDLILTEEVTEYCLVLYRYENPAES